MDDRNQAALKKEAVRRFAYLMTIGCVACFHDGKNGSRPEIHHCKGHEFSSMGKRACDMNTIPLCYEHHRGQYGYHHSPAKFERRYGTQMELLNKTNKLLEQLGYVRNTSGT